MRSNDFFLNVRLFLFFSVKPFFNKELADITVLAGKTVKFHCSVGGGKFYIFDISLKYLVVFLEIVWINGLHSMI